MAQILDRQWVLKHFQWIYDHRHKLMIKPCANFIISGFVINSFGCPYYGYAIEQITLKNLITLWDNGFVYKNFPLIHYRISHGDSSTHIAYIYRGKVFSHRFLWNDKNSFIPSPEVKRILKELRHT